MTRPRVVFLDAGFLPGALALSGRDDLDYQAYEQTLPAQVAGRIARAQVVITSKVPVDDAAMGAAAGLRFICVAGAGMDHVDAVAARARGIRIDNVPDYGAQSVAEHVIASLFALRRHLGLYSLAARDGRWSASPRFYWDGPSITELSGSLLGIVGRGRIGEALARAARGLGMQVRFASSPRRPPQDDDLPFEVLLAQADALSLHVPLNDVTRAMIGGAQLRTMKPGAVLVNTGRGALVDAAALAQALREGRIAGAAIDVLDVEPPPAAHPLLAAELPGLLLTPHVAWASQQAQGRLAEGICTRVLAQLGRT